MLSPWLEILDPMWRDFDRIRQEIEQIFDFGTPVGDIRSAIRGTFPAVNVGETPDKVMVYIFAPGLDPSKLDLTIEKNLLSIAGERNTDADVGENVQPQGYHRRERFSGKFRRVISLPESIDPSNVEAKYTNGILIVTIGKKEEEKSRKIEVTIS